MAIGIAAAVAVAVAIVGVIVHQRYFGPTNEQRASDEYAEKISVEGYRLIDRRMDSRLGPKVHVYLGPAESDPLEVISGPGLELAPPEVGREIDDRFVSIGYGKVRQSQVGMHCIVHVKRLRDGVEPPETYELATGQRRAVRAGTLAILEITVPCQHTTR